MDGPAWVEKPGLASLAAGNLRCQYAGKLPVNALRTAIDHLAEKLFILRIMKATPIAFSFLLLAGMLRPVIANDQLVYFGCYTNEKSGSKGIMVSRFDSKTGTLTPAKLAVATGNPSFLAIHPNKKYLYAVGEMAAAAGEGKQKGKGGGVSAFSISQPEGTLTLINQVSSGGGGPCHISTDQTGSMAMVANYGGGSVASFKIQPDGSLSEPVSFIQHDGSSVNPQRQKEPHAHSINPTPDNKFALVCDLGIDKVLCYRMDPVTGKLESHGHTTTPPGGGPRHLAFHPSGKQFFVNNELTLSATTFSYGEDGKLTQSGTVSTLPAADQGKTGFSTAETVAHPNGKVVYVSNRTHDTLAVFRCDPTTGALTLVQNAAAEVQVPRNFALDPSGNWLIAAGQNSNTVAVHKVDAESGKLTFTGNKIDVGGSVCVRFVPIAKQ